MAVPLITSTDLSFWAFNDASGDMSDQFLAKLLAWKTVIDALSGGGALLNVQRFTSGSGTYTPTPGATKAIVSVWGGGGGGGGCAAITAGNNAAGGAGGGGAYTEVFVNPGAALTGGAYTVGAAGSTSTGADGGTGGTSSIVVSGTTVSADGGVGGSRGVDGLGTTNSAHAGGVGGTSPLASGGTFTYLKRRIGQQGGFGLTWSTLAIGGAAGAPGLGAASGRNSVQTGAGGGNGQDSLAFEPGAGGGGAVQIGTSSGATRIGGTPAAGEIVVVEFT